MALSEQRPLSPRSRRNRDPIHKVQIVEVLQSLHSLRLKKSCPRVVRRDYIGAVGPQKHRRSLILECVAVGRKSPCLGYSVIVLILSKLPGYLPQAVPVPSGRRLGQSELLKERLIDKSRARKGRHGHTDEPTVVGERLQQVGKEIPAVQIFIPFQERLQIHDQRGLANDVAPDIVDDVTEKQDITRNASGSLHDDQFGQRLARSVDLVVDLYPGMGGLK